MKFVRPKRLPEANIQAELYHELRKANIRCCLEYSMYCEETRSNLRADIITIIGDDIGCIIECKSRGGNFAIDKEGKQYRQYRTFNIPLFYCMKFTHVKMTLESIIKLHKTGAYKLSDMQPFDDEKKAHRRREKKLSRLTKKQRYNDNWRLLIDSGVEYQHFSDSHVRIMRKVDFWPSTGKFMIMNTNSPRKGGFHVMMEEFEK